MENPITTEHPRILRLQETASTNLYLREYLRTERLPEGSAVVAGFQTGGRGQAGNHWESAPDKNLLFSLVLYPEYVPANRPFVLSEITSLAVKEALEAYVAPITVKWPNDIYWEDRKICGILIENDLMGSSIARSIIGIGINLNQAAFHSDAPNPVSLAQITGKEYDAEEVLQRFLRIFYGYYLLVLQEKYDAVKAAYMQSLYRREGYHPFSDANGSFSASIYDVEDTGYLVLKTKNGEKRRYAFKEVCWLY